MEELPESDLEGQFGYGPFPAELDRLNWGALIFGWVWAIWHGLGLWSALLFVGGFVGFVLVTLARTSALGQSLAAQFAIIAAYAAVTWTVLAVFAFRANRLFWERQGRRIQAGALHPYKTRPVADYEASQLLVAPLGFALLVLGYVVSWVKAAVAPNRGMAPGNLKATLFVTGCDALSIAAIWYFDRRRRAKLTSAST